MTTSKRRLLFACNRLALARVRKAKGSTPYGCCFCANPIAAGDEYRDAGSIKSHVYCLTAVAREFKDSKGGNLK